MLNSDFILVTYYPYNEIGDKFYWYNRKWGDIKWVYQR
jgi:hypothetical protein